MVETITNNVFIQKVLLVTLITILPLVPAYILFKFLPAKSIVTGPFKGMNVNFSGATAIYFIIFVTIFTTSQFWKLDNGEKGDQKNYEVWNVEGRLKADGVENYNENDERFEINVLPQEEPEEGGVFSFTILREREDNRMQFPNLRFGDADGDYTTETIYLDSAVIKKDYAKFNIQRNYSNNTIEIKNPIKLVKEITSK